jgi:hypothetical protein
MLLYWCLLTHDAIAVAVSHIGIGWMITSHWGNAMPPCLGTGNPSIIVVIVLSQHI